MAEDGRSSYSSTQAVEPAFGSLPDRHLGTRLENEAEAHRHSVRGRMADGSPLSQSAPAALRERFRGLLDGLSE